jgi:hypothetical protein
MAKGKAAVSSDFSKFYGKNQVAIEEAKKAENSMSSGPCPVGWKGQCVLLEAAAEVGKDKKDKTGNVVAGNPRFRFKFGIVGDPTYQGKTFQKYWVLFQSEKASPMDRLEWFLNECESMGLPREVRVNHTSPDEVLNWFMESEMVFEVACESDDYATDKKAMRVTSPQQAVDGTTSMLPSDTPDNYATTATNSSPGEIEVGSTVKFLNSKWTVAERNGDNLVIEKDDNGKVRTRDCNIAAVELM